MKNKFLLLVAASAVAVTNASAALTIDTTGIEADIVTAGEKGVAIALLVGGGLIAFGLVKKFIK